jgi:hypothetical protein
MRAELPAVHEHRRFPIDCVEVQQRPASAPRTGHVERTVIPEPVGFTDFLHHARQRGLDGKRHEDAAVERRRRRLTAWPDGVVPESVQIQPVAAHQLRTRILGTCPRRRNIRGPLRHQRTSGRLPLCDRDSRRPDERDGNQRQRDVFHGYTVPP